MKPEWMIRVDDRLVHGQVCVGWCDALQIHQLILADDEIAACEFERELYACCPGEDQNLRFASLDELAGLLKTPPVEPTMVVLAGLESLQRLAEQVELPGEVVLGGIHHQPGARELTDYIFLLPAQEEMLKNLLAKGLRIVGQPLPGSPRTDLARLL